MTRFLHLALLSTAIGFSSMNIIACGSDKKEKKDDDDDDKKDKDDDDKKDKDDDDDDKKDKDDDDDKKDKDDDDKKSKDKRVSVESLCKLASKKAKDWEDWEGEEECEEELDEMMEEIEEDCGKKLATRALKELDRCIVGNDDEDDIKDCFSEAFEKLEEACDKD